MEEMSSDLMPYRRPKGWMGTQHGRKPAACVQASGTACREIRAIWWKA